MSTMTYKGVDIEPRIWELQAGGFAVEVLLTHHLGPQVTQQKVSAANEFKTREEAEKAGFRLGMDAIDGRLDGV